MIRPTDTLKITKNLIRLCMKPYISVPKLQKEANMSYAQIKSKVKKIWSEKDIRQLIAMRKNMRSHLQLYLFQKALYRQVKPYARIEKIQFDLLLEELQQINNISYLSSGLWVFYHINTLLQNKTQPAHKERYIKTILKYFSLLKQHIHKDPSKKLTVLTDNILLKSFSFTEDQPFSKILKTQYLEIINQLSDHVKDEQLTQLFPFSVFNSTDLPILEETFLHKIYHRLPINNLKQIESTFALLGRFSVPENFLIKKTLKQIELLQILNFDDYLSVSNVFYIMLRKIGVKRSQQVQLMRNLALKGLEKFISLRGFQEKITERVIQKMGQAKEKLLDEAQLMPLVKLKYSVKLLRAVIANLHLHTTHSQTLWDLFTRQPIKDLFHQVSYLGDILAQSIYIHDLYGKDYPSTCKNSINQARLQFQRVLTNLNKICSKKLTEGDYIDQTFHFEEMISTPVSEQKMYVEIKKMLGSEQQKQKRILCSIRNDQAILNALMRKETTLGICRVLKSVLEYDVREDVWEYPYFCHFLVKKLKGGELYLTLTGKLDKNLRNPQIHFGKTSKVVNFNVREYSKTIEAIVKQEL